MKSIFQLLLAVLISSCAHIVPPDGGTKDLIAPKLLKAKPSNNALNTFPSKVILTFNENIDLVNIADNVRLTPDINSLPIIKVQKNKLSIQFPKDSLKPNTTYTLNFGNALVDLNEKNVLSNFTYTFSTGAILDTNYIEGRVINIKDKTPVEKCLITLINTDNKVKYTTTSGETGVWKIYNIAKGNYSLLVLEDKNTNKKPDLNEGYYFKKVSIDSTLSIIPPP